MAEGLIEVEPKDSKFQAYLFDGTRGRAWEIYKWALTWRTPDAPWGFSLADDAEPDPLIFWPPNALPGRVPSGWTVLRGPDNTPAMIGPEKLARLFVPTGREVEYDATPPGS